ncbi:MAG TPA: ABC transporter permease [Acholeplasma sp.]|nr:ABC transporter permease [Acholeplasmatales bacterium]HHV33431.1 ABC transporter permease [Acholeplasma sp.]
MENFRPFESEKPKRKRKRKIENKGTLLGIPYYVILIGLIIIPLVLIFFYSITVYEGNMFYKLTLEHFQNFFKQGSFVRTMLDSIKIALITTAVCLLIGYPAAYLISKQSPKVQAILILAVTVPMWINLLILTTAWVQILDLINPKLLGTDFAIIIGMVNIYLPFMILPIYSVLTRINPRLYEAAADLGANSFRTFMRVTLPLSIGGVLSGITMVLLPAATTIVIPNKLGLGRYLIGSLIEDRFFQAGNWNEGAAIAIILASIIMILIVFTRRFDKVSEVEKDDV